MNKHCTVLTFPVLLAYAVLINYSYTDIDTFIENMNYEFPSKEVWCRVEWEDLAITDLRPSQTKTLKLAENKFGVESKVYLPSKKWKGEIVAYGDSENSLNGKHDESANENHGRPDKLNKKNGQTKTLNKKAKKRTLVEVEEPIRKNAKKAKAQKKKKEKTAETVNNAKKTVEKAAEEGNVAKKKSLKQLREERRVAVRNTALIQMRDFAPSAPIETPSRTAEPTPPRTAEPTPPRTAEPTPLRAAEPITPRTAEPTPLRTGEPTQPRTAEPTPLRTAEPTPLRTAEPITLRTAEPIPPRTAEPTPLRTAEPIPSPTSSIATSPPAFEAMYNALRREMNQMSEKIASLQNTSPTPPRLSYSDKVLAMCRSSGNYVKATRMLVSKEFSITEQQTMTISGFAKGREVGQFDPEKVEKIRNCVCQLFPGTRISDINRIIGKKCLEKRRFSNITNTCQQ